MTGIRPTVFAIALLLVATLAHAQVYRWKDAKGVTHYSDAPPPKGEYQARRVATPQPPASATAPAPAATGAPAPGKPSEATEADAAAQRERAKANCGIATANLERLKASGDIGYDADGDGKPDKILSTDERAQQAKVAADAIASYCRGTASPS